MRRLLLLVGTITLLMQSVAQAETLRVLNWSDYVDEATLEQFQQEQGVELVYELFESEDEFLEKFLDTDEPWDVVVPPAAMVPFLNKREYLSVLDKSLLPTYGGLDTGLMSQVAEKDPGNRFAVPYMWGTTGLGVNEEMLQAQGIDASKMSSWDLLYDPAIRKKAANCGIALLNEQVEMFSTALIYLGHSVNTSNPDELKAAGDLLKAAVGDSRYLHTSQYSTDLAENKVCLVVGYSGDILADVEEVENEAASYHIPEEGAVVWIDVMLIPANSTRKELAHKFINFMSQPDIAAVNTNYVAYPNAVPASLPMVDDEVKNDPTVYPSDEIRSRFQALAPADRKIRRIKRKLWVSAQCQKGRFCQIPMRSPYGY